MTAGWHSDPNVRLPCFGSAALPRTLQPGNFLARLRRQRNLGLDIASRSRKILF